MDGAQAACAVEQAEGAVHALGVGEGETGETVVEKDRGGGGDRGSALALDFQLFAELRGRVGRGNGKGLSCKQACESAEKR